jgi:hypothetical protein
LQNKELKKIIEFSGFFGKIFATWQPKKNKKNKESYNGYFGTVFAKFAIF